MPAKPPNRTTVTPLSTALAVYYGLLIVMLLASLAPEYRVWGLNHWAYYDTGTTWGLFIFGALLPLGWWAMQRRRPAAPRPGRHSSATTGISTAIIALFAVAGGLLPNTTHFLGDGYMYLDMLAENPAFAQARAAGASLIYRATLSLLGGPGEANAIATFRIISVLSGIWTLTFVAFTAQRLYTDSRRRLLLLLAVAASGSSLLFFGYVELYAPFVAAVATFCCVGLMVSAGKLGRWWLVPATILVASIHVLGVTLLPAALYLALRGTPIARRVLGSPFRVRFYGTLAVIVAALSLFAYFYSNNYFFRFAFVPLVDGRFTVEGYTMFSAGHLLDIANELLLLLPGLPLLAAILWISKGSSLTAEPGQRFLLIAAVCSLGALVVFDPKLGMPRDWDLFAFAGIPLVLLVTQAVLRHYDRLPTARFAVALSIGLGLLSLGSRVVALTQDDLSLARMRDYSALDRVKNQMGRQRLIRYYVDRDLEFEVQQEYSRFQRDYPEADLVRQGVAYTRDGRYDSAMALLRQALRYNPISRAAYSDLGIVFQQTGQLDSAIACFEIADGLMPDAPKNLCNLGMTYYMAGDLPAATRTLYRAIDADSTLRFPYIWLAYTSLADGNLARYAWCLDHLGKDPQTKWPVFKSLAATALRDGAGAAANHAIALGIRAGMPAGVVDSLVSSHPEIAWEHAPGMPSTAFSKQP